MEEAPPGGWGKEDEVPEDNTTWITVNGAHIPVKEGETRRQAMDRHFKGAEKFKGEKSPSQKYPGLSKEDRVVMAGMDKAEASKKAHDESPKNIKNIPQEKLVEEMNAIPKEKGSFNLYRGRNKERMNEITSELNRRGLKAKGQNV